MKTVVLYQSKYGSTRRYAEWIAQELGAELAEAKGVGPALLAGADTIVLGGGLYAGGIAGIGALAKNAGLLRGKRLALFSVGLSDPSLPETEEAIRENMRRALPGELLPQVKLFCLRGGMDYQKLGPVHRMMMGMMKKMLLKKPEAERTESDRGLLETYGKAIDFTDRGSIAPLVEYCRRQ